MLQCRAGIPVVLSLLCLSSSAVAGDVSIDTARSVAENWLQHALAVQKMGAAAKVQIVQEEVMKVGDKTVGYNFILSPAGHIIVPSRDELPAVKLYSLTSTLSMADNSEPAQWIKGILLEVGQKLDQHPAELAAQDPASNPNRRLWSRFGVDSAMFDDAASEPSFTLGQLLSTTWYQNDPYNLLTPLWFDGSATLSGCVATSAAQIMKYWNWPPTGQGSYSYQWYNGASDVTLSADFSTSTYDWANMIDSYLFGATDVQRYAVAKLMSDVGIAFHTLFSPTASSAWVSINAPVYPTYFKYQNTTQTVRRMSYASDSAWMQVFKNEVQHLRPSQIEISSTTEQAQHAAVVDGYTNSPTEQVHINFGWNGSYDGWYATNNIVGMGHVFDDMPGMAAIIGIQPDSSSNLPPLVNAGPDQTIMLPAVANLQGTVGDDGRPNPPDAVTTIWSKVSGPDIVRFADASAAVTTATFSTAGSYVLRLTANDSALSGSDDVAISVQAPDPCAGQCTGPVDFTFPLYGSYQSGNLGTGAICRRTMSNISGGNCGNFHSPRTLQVNGVTKVCNGQNWQSIPAKRNGGYCIQATSGDYAWAYFTAW